MVLAPCPSAHPASFGCAVEMGTSLSYPGLPVLPLPTVPPSYVSLPKKIKLAPFALLNLAFLPSLRNRL